MPNRSESASSSDGSSTLSLVDRGHQPPCTKPQDRCAGFNRKRNIPIVGRCARGAPMCSVVANMCCLTSIRCLCARFVRGRSALLRMPRPNPPLWRGRRCLGGFKPAGIRMNVGGAEQLRLARTEQHRCSWSAVDAFSADLRTRILLDTSIPVWIADFLMSCRCLTSRQPCKSRKGRL